MQSPVPVFVSSTFVDLQQYRAAVRDVLHRMSAAVKGMEYFGATPETPKDECLRMVREARYYIGLFGMRYGSIDVESGKSMTQLEYEEAQRIRLPTLIYLLDEDRQPVLPKHVDLGEPGRLLQDLKGVLKSRHVVSFFTTPEDLAARVAQDVPAMVERSGGHVQRGELAKLVETLQRVSWLTPERYAFLKREIGSAAEVTRSDEVLKEAMEFLLAGDRLAAVFLLTRKERVDFRVATDALMEMERKIAGVIERGARLLQNAGESSTEGARE